MANDESILSAKIELKPALPALEFISWFGGSFHKYFPSHITGRSTYSPFLCNFSTASEEYPINIQVIADDNPDPGLARTAYTMLEMRQEFSRLGQKTLVVEIDIEKVAQSLAVMIYQVDPMAAEWIKRFVVGLVDQWENASVSVGHWMLKGGSGTFDRNSIDVKDVAIVELWQSGETSSAIAKKANLSIASLRNKITKLRKQYGESIVPYRRRPSISDD